MTTQDILHLHADRIISDYYNGRSIKSIADEFNCNSGTVWYFLDGRGVIVRRRSENYGTSDRYLEAIKSGLAEGKSAYRIAKDLNVRKDLVRGVMKRHGLSSPHKSSQRADPLKNHADEIVARYEAGESMCKIADDFNTSSPSVLNILRRRGVESRPKAKYTQDESFFDDIDTEAKAYILGWFYADGNNLKNGRGIRLQITDLDILTRIQREMKHTGPILPRPQRSPRHKVIHSLQLNSKRLSEALARKGCPAAKTFLLKFPGEGIVPQHLVSHFARGYFDGDGCITKSRSRWMISFVGTRHMVDGLSAASGVVGGFGCCHPERNNDNWTWQVYRKAEFPRFAEWLYRDATIFLPRKRDKYEQFLTDFNAHSVAKATTPSRRPTILAGTPA